MHVVGLGLGNSLQFEVSFGVCRIWINREQVGFVPVRDGEV